MITSLDFLKKVILEEVVNKDTDKEAQVPASVFIIADC